MPVPSRKHPAIEAVLSNFLGVSRSETIEQGLCVPPPIGCGQPAELETGQ